MTEYSFPVVDEPLSADQWGSVTLGVGSGILDGGDGPYSLINISAQNDTVDIATGSGGVAHAIVNGFYHKIDAEVTLSIPAVGSTTTYYVALQYDPLRAALPVKLDVFTELDRDQGKVYLVLHTIVRQPSMVLSSATFKSLRPRIAPSLMINSDELPAPADVLHGTIAVAPGNPNNDEAVVWMAVTDSNPRWVRIADQAGTFTWFEYPNAGAWVSPVAGGFKRSLGRRGKQRRLRGRVGLNNGIFETDRSYDVPLPDLIAQDRPQASMAFHVATSSAHGGYLSVSSNGDVNFRPGATCSWISLDGVEWEVA